MRGNSSHFVKRFSTLQKKLQELQAQLLHISAISTAGDPIPESLSQDIEQIFIFLNNLLSTEIASSPSKPNHLHHIANSLADLESTFRELCTSPTGEFTAPVAGKLETKSNCSCTDSCLNEEEDFYAAVEEQAVPVKVEKRVEESENGSVWGRRDSFVMGSGVVIGAVFMGLETSTPDFATVIASNRFFFSSPGRSNSIIESSSSVSSSSMSSLPPTAISKINETETVIGGSVATPTFSPDPYMDFRRSMQEMVESRDLVDVRANWDYLHELLMCYLALNPKSTHKFIVTAFADLLLALMPSPSDGGPR